MHKLTFLTLNSKLKLLKVEKMLATMEKSLWPGTSLDAKPKY